MMNLAFKYLHRFHFIIALFSIALIYLCLTFPSYAAEKSGSCGENLTWTLTGDVMIINGSGDMTDYADGALAPWFGVAKEIHTIILSEEMTSIGNYAFMGCENVTSIVIPETVTEIGECSFAQCRNLQYLDLGNHLQIIGEGAFQECEMLPWVEIPGSVTEIRANAFYRCYSLLAGNIPKTVKVLGESVFSYCTDMVRATINAPVEELPGWTFYGCSSLSDVSLASEIVRAGDYAFLFCENLNGIYTQGGKLETVHALEESIYNKDGSPKEGLLNAYEMPKFSVVEIDDGKTYSQIKMVDSVSVVASIRFETNYENEQDTAKIIVKTFILDKYGWETLSEIAEESLKYSKLPSITMEIYTKEDRIDSESLKYFANKPIELYIYAKSGEAWKIDMSKMELGSFTGQYILEEMAKEHAQEFEEAIQENESTAGLTTIPQQELPMFGPYDPSSVDTDTPDLETVDSDPEASNLTDAEGTTYYISKRSSKWGITVKQFSVYVALWIASAVLIVAVIMLTANQRKKSKEQYEELVKQGEAEDAIAEEELQLQIMKEMLNPKK